jgi:hypothetical protein
MRAGPLVSRARGGGQIIGTFADPGSEPPIASMAERRGFPTELPASSVSTHQWHSEWHVDPAGIGCLQAQPAGGGGRGAEESRGDLHRLRVEPLRKLSTADQRLGSNAERARTSERTASDRHRRHHLAMYG